MKLMIKQKIMENKLNEDIYLVVQGGLISYAIPLALMSIPNVV